MQPSLIDRIKPLGKIIELNKETILFREGDPCQNFVFVLDGTIKVQKTSESGKSVTLYHVQKNDLCILTTSGLLSEKNYSAEGSTITDTTALILDKKTFLELINQDIQFRTEVFNSLSNRITDLVLKIDEVTLQNMRPRLIRFILETAKEKDFLELSHQQIAEEIGTAREVVSRQLKLLEAQGLVRIGRKKIYDIKQLALQQLI